jgi:hypothetical protein
MAVRERVKEGAAGAVGAEAKRIDLANRANAPKTDYAGRLAMLSALLLPQFALLAAGRHSGAEQLSAWFTASVENSKEIMASPEVILGLAMFLPERFLYTFVWVAPKLYTKMVSMIGTGPMFEPIEFLFQGFVLCKGLQAGAFIQLYLRCGVPPIWETSDFSIWQMTTGISMMAVGQILNMWIYAAIGKKGVYYGCRLGAKIPWVYGRPFSLCPYHPQYVGAVLTIFGGVIALATPQHCEKGWLALCAGQLVSYIYMGLVEQYL